MVFIFREEKTCIIFFAILSAVKVEKHRRCQSISLITSKYRSLPSVADSIDYRSISINAATLNSHLILSARLLLNAYICPIIFYKLSPHWFLILFFLYFITPLLQRNVIMTVILPMELLLIYCLLFNFFIPFLQILCHIGEK